MNLRACFPVFPMFVAGIILENASNIGTDARNGRCPFEVIGFQGDSMSRSFQAPFAATIASVGAVMAVTLAGGMLIFMSGILEVSAEPQSAAPQVTVAAYPSHAKGDRLPVLVKGTACSPRGWPHYEQSCQFDQRRSADEARTVRVIALRYAAPPPNTQRPARAGRFRYLCRAATLQWSSSAKADDPVSIASPVSTGSPAGACHRAGQRPDPLAGDDNRDWPRPRERTEVLLREGIML